MASSSFQLIGSRGCGSLRSDVLQGPFREDCHDGAATHLDLYAVGDLDLHVFIAEIDDAAKESALGLYLVTLLHRVDKRLVLFLALDLRTYGDDKHLLRVSPGIAGVLPYGPNLGGAVEMRIFAEQAPGNYACRIAFPPRDDAFSTVTHDEATDADAPTPLPPNAEVTGQFGEGDRGDRLSLMLEPGALSALTCRDGSGAALPPRRLRPVGSEALTAALRQQPLADGSIVITGPPSGEAVLEIRPGGDDAAWRCSLAGADRFRAPSDMGAMAAFTAPRDRARNPDAEALAAYDPQAALAVLSGGQPDWLTPTQVRDDLALPAAARRREQRPDAVDDGLAAGHQVAAGVGEGSSGEAVDGGLTIQNT